LFLDNNTRFRILILIDARTNLNRIAKNFAAASSMDRTYVITGGASGIGAATAKYLRERGGRVISCDLHDADVVADLSTANGRATLVDGVARLANGRIDAIIANAGGGRPETMLQVNFFGAVATLEGLRPLLAGSPAPRAAAVSSIASLGRTDPCLVEACLALDENKAIALANELNARAAASQGDAGTRAGQVALDLYRNAKYALNCWCRRAAVKPEWAGAGITLNVLGPGVIDTPAAQYILNDPGASASIGAMMPMKGAFPGRPDSMAAALAWCVSAENALMTGQVIFVDGGFECLARGERHW
jgi:NAD(P)-dependent dehydrogenase (short-subunit alcohol dehydrogenase family)